MVLLVLLFLKNFIHEVQSNNEKFEDLKQKEAEINKLLKEIRGLGEDGRIVAKEFFEFDLKKFLHINLHLDKEKWDEKLKEERERLLKEVQDREENRRRQEEERRRQEEEWRRQEEERRRQQEGGGGWWNGFWNRRPAPPQDENKELLIEVLKTLPDEVSIKELQQAFGLELDFTRCPIGAMCDDEIEDGAEIVIIGGCNHIICKDCVDSLNAASEGDPVRYNARIKEDYAKCPMCRNISNFTRTVTFKKDD